MRTTWEALAVPGWLMVLILQSLGQRLQHGSGNGPFCKISGGSDLAQCEQSQVTTPPVQRTPVLLRQPRARKLATLRKANIL